MNDIIERIPLDRITPHPGNRNIGGFDQARLEQLAESIKAVGVQQPAVVRAKGEGYELVAGERRWRASKLAGLDYLPCIVRDLDDAQALRIQIIENLQREDIHPLDEADGYERLRKEGSYDVELLAQEVGRSTSHVYQRLRLQNLIPSARTLLLEGQITAAHASLIARLGPGQQQSILDSPFHYRWGEESNPVTCRELGEWIDMNILMELSKVAWKLDDETLGVPRIGSCLACQSRTGYAPALFEDLGKKDYCTDPECFKAKQEAIVALRRRELAGTPHIEAIEGYGFGKKLAKGVLERGKWEECKKKDSGALRVLIVDGASCGRLTWGKKVEAATVRPSPPRPSRPSLPEAVGSAEERAAEQARRDLEEKRLDAKLLTNRKLLDLVMHNIDLELSRGNGLPVGILRLIAWEAWDLISIEAQEGIAGRLGWHDMEGHQSLDDIAHANIFVMLEARLYSLLVLCHLAPAFSQSRWGPSISTALLEAASLWGIDAQAVSAETHAQLGIEPEKDDEEDEE